MKALQSFDHLIGRGRNVARKYLFGWFNI